MFENRGDVFPRKEHSTLVESSNWETTVGGGLKTCYIFCFFLLPLVAEMVQVE